MDKKPKRPLQCVWCVGFIHRGHGHLDFCVMTQRAQAVIVMCSDRATAEHIVDLHNAALKAKKVKTG